MKRYALSFWMLVVAALATSAGAQIPGPTGQYSETAHGSFAVCLNPAKGYSEESCSANNALVYPITETLIGAGTIGSGIYCENDYVVDADLPPDVTPSSVTLNEHSVGKTTSYDSTTGTGTATFTDYTGGSCNGTSFDSSGATEVSSGTMQFIVSEGGKRENWNITQLTNPTNSLGSVSYTGTNVTQAK
jgi:hypothetical protein